MTLLKMQVVLFVRFGLLHGNSLLQGWLHFLVFKQMACHLPHEANVERRFSILPVSKTQAPTPVLESSSSSTHACHTLTYWVCQHGNRS